MPIAGMSSPTRPVRLSHQGMTKGSHPCRARLPSEPPSPFPGMRGLSQATLPMYPARPAEQSSLNPFRSYLDAQQASGEAPTMTAPRSPYAGELNTCPWSASVCIIKAIRGNCSLTA